jgi:hypothetical protein
VTNKKINKRDDKIANEARWAKYASSDEGIAASLSDTKEAQRLDALNNLVNKLQAENNASGLLLTSEAMGYAQEEFGQRIESQRNKITRKVNNQFAKAIDVHSSEYAINRRTSSVPSQQQIFKEAITHQDRYVPTEVLLNQQEDLIRMASAKGRIVASKARGVFFRRSNCFK